MAVPKRKPSLSRRGMRRAHQALRAPGRSACPRCHTIRLPHRVCHVCGYYGGQKRIEIESGA